MASLYYKASRAAVLCCLPLFFGNQAVSADENITSKRLFSMSLQELMDIEVQMETAGKAPEKIADIPASVVLIERQDIEQFGYRSLQEILEHIPGLYPTNDYSWDGVNFGVRGFWTGVVNRNMIILVNGVNQIMDYQSNFPLNNIDVPVEAIDRIEVIRGPNSVIYGTGAFFGVINIITNEATNQKSETIVSSSIGTQDTKKLSVRTSGKEGGFQYGLNTSISNTNGIDQPLYKMSSSQLAGNTKGKLESREKYIQFYGTTGSLNIDFSYAETNMEQYLIVPSVSNGSPNNVQSMKFACGYNHRLSDRIFLRSKLSYHSSSSKAHYDIYMENFDMGQEIGTNAYELDVNALIKLNSRIDLLAGLYQHSALKIYNEVIGPSMADPTLKHLVLELDDGETLDIRAFYSQINYSPSVHVKLVTGIRIEQMPKYTIRMKLPPADAGLPSTALKADYDYDQIALIPRVAALYTINQNHILKLLYGQAINRPSFQQNVDKFLGIQDYLKPEKIYTYEINYISSFFKGITTGISVFKNELNDLLLRKQGLNPNGSYYSYFSNIGKMVTYGTEITLKAEPISKLLFEFSGTYQRTEDKNNENVDVAFSPNWLAYGQISYRYKRIIGSITGRYVDEMKAYWDPTIRNVDGTLGNRIGRDVPGYVSFGANLRIENILLKGFYCNIRGANLLDTDIYFPTYTNNPWANQGTMDLGRSFLFTLGMDI